MRKAEDFLKSSAFLWGLNDLLYGKSHTSDFHVLKSSRKRPACGFILLFCSIYAYFAYFPQAGRLRERGTNLFENN